MPLFLRQISEQEVGHLCLGTGRIRASQLAEEAIHLVGMAAGDEDRHERYQLMLSAFE